MIILDSNIICSDYKLKGNNFRLFLDYIKRTNSKVALPKIVVEEVKHNYYNEILNTSNVIDRELKALSRRISDQDIPGNPLTEELTLKVALDFRLWFDNVLQEYQVEILDYPEVSHASIASRAIRKKKPFKGNGDGYRDTLIWETILSQINENTKVIFVSNNIKDYCVQENRNELHDNLKQELIDKKLNKENLMFYPELKQFIEDFVLPNLAKQDDLKQRIIDRTYPFETLDVVLFQKLKEVITGFNPDINELYFENEFEDPILVGLESEPHGLSVTDVRTVNSNEAYISIEIRTMALFEGQVKKHSINKIDGCFKYVPSDYNIMYFEAYKVVPIYVHFNAIYSNQTCQISSIEVEKIEGF